METAVTRTTPDQQPALDQAAAWIARLRAEDVSDADRSRFACWLREDAGNPAAFDRMLELWKDLGVLRELPLEIPRVAPARRWQLPLALAAAASLAALLLLPRGATPPALELRTPVGGFRQVRLEDGSELTLNTDTALRVALGQDARTVTMAQGEAFFAVAPDAAHPFSAVCGEASVTVLGTAWQINANLINGEGKVKVDSFVPTEGATGWSDTWMIATKAQHPNCMYKWMDYIISPSANAQVAEWFGEAPAQTLACEKTTDKNFCTQFHALDAAYANSISYWTTPTKNCLDGRGDICKDYAAWVQAWTEIKG